MQLFRPLTAAARSPRGRGIGDRIEAAGARIMPVRPWPLLFGAILIGALLVGALIVTMAQSSHGRRAAERIYVHTLDVLITANELESALVSAVRGERGYLLTGDARFLAPYARARAEAPRLLGRLAAQTRGHPAQQRRMTALRAQTERYFADLDAIIRLHRSARQAEALARIRAGARRDALDRLLETLDQVKTEEKRLLAQRRIANDAAARQIVRYRKALSAVAVLLLLVAAAAGWAALRAHARALKAMGELRRIAITDELTSLANRRYFLSRLETEAARAQHNGRPLCLAIIDVDHFKRINDLHGHLVGDEVLRTLARIARQETRVADLVGRIGGEEFALLMPDTPLDHALLVCDRLRAAAAVHHAPIPAGGAIVATISTGVAALRSGERPATLISRADAALYLAKDSGRNQVRLAA